MFECLDGGVADASDQFVKWWVTAAIGAQHQRVNEEADEVLMLDTVAAGHRYPDEDVAALGVAASSTLNAASSTMNSVVFVRRASCWSATVVFDGNWNSHVAPAKLGTAGRGLSGSSSSAAGAPQALPSSTRYLVGLRAV